jgi:hypothetical protein
MTRCGKNDDQKKARQQGAPGKDACSHRSSLSYLSDLGLEVDVVPRRHVPGA